MATYIQKNFWTSLALFLIAAAAGIFLSVGGKIFAINGTPPMVPTGLTASSSSSSSVDLTWNASTDSTGTSTGISYLIFRSGTQVATTTAGSLMFTDTGLSPSTSYSYTIAASDSAGDVSAQSASVPVMTLADNGQGSSSTSTLISIPLNLTASATSETSIDLSWSPSTITSTTSTSTVAGYVLFRDGTQVATPSSTAFTDMNLTPGTTYTYMVSAFDNLGNSSDQSTTVAATTLGTAPTPTPTATTTPTPTPTPTATTTPTPTPTPTDTTTPTPTPTVTPTPTPTPTTTPVTGNIGWIVIPLNVYNQLSGVTATSTGGSMGSSTPPGQYKFLNGYPTLNGNFVDCQGFIDNDPAHHSSDPNDTDPAHHAGKMCPNGLPAVQNNPWGNPGSMAWRNAMLNILFSDGFNGNNGLTQWVVIPLNAQNIAALSSYLNGQTLP